MAIKIEDLQMILIQSGIKDAAQRSAIIKAAQALEEEAKAEREEQKGPKLKFQYSILVRCDDPAVKKVLESTEGWITKTAEHIDQGEIINRITVASARHNESLKKKLKNKISSYAEYFRLVKGKTLKDPETGVKNVTKEPVRIIVLDQAEIKFN